MKAVSLFSGCGGTDLGFESAGIPISQAFDTDPVAVASYNLNVKDCAIVQDVCTIDQFPANIDVIVATPPCQGFSTAGGYRHDDPRNDLFMTSCNAIAVARPKVAMIENVAAITNRRNKPLLERGVAVLQDAGYYVETVLLACDKYGVPQRRQRAFIIARSDGRSFNTDSLSEKTTKTTLRNALHGLAIGTNAHEPTVLLEGSKHARIARAISSGQKLCNVRAGEKSVATWQIPDVFGKTTRKERELLVAVRSLRRRNRKRDFGDADPVAIEELEAHLKTSVEQLISSLFDKGYLRKVGCKFDLKNTFNGKYRRLDFEDSSPTVDTRFGDYQLFLHPVESRGMSVREAARIQGFPDSFLFDGSSRDSFRLIGNAVPPPVAARVAEIAKGLI
ncbi:DNA cytosine methyltransferase [Roseobacter sp. YSTF-M11]|uniref:DNA cytosine methyltransferase n=1 Tax=Roseobacter insulae TaxID=2859783 RepID=A0A9X1K4B7_9RHOB|nr:DNA cytosine methyltransferase [Roseobacter insulae]MBW4709557.1 DNA cytosine methyltransferase [Roseobacter insulae]